MEFSLTAITCEYTSSLQGEQFLPSPVQCTGLGHYVAFQSVCQRVSNHFSPHPPPYIELSFSSSLYWYIYSPQTSQIQALEEGSARTYVGATP